MKIKALQARKGNIINFRGELYRITEHAHVTPGKGPAMVQVKMKRLSDSSKAENRFRPDESIEKIALLSKEFQFLYDDGNNYTFMDLETFEQTQFNNETLGDAVNYLLPEIVVQIQFYNGKAVGIELPASVELKIVETEPNLKGATASGSNKPATLETGLVTQIPPFIEVGEVIRIDTRDGKYLDRVK